MSVAQKILNKKEENIQKALGTFDDHYLKCAECGKVFHKGKLEIIYTYETVHVMNGTIIRQCTGTTYKCKCGSENFE